MARPREFDEESALRKAMETFWTKGYEATSLSDLTESMNMSRSSLYAAFGDKERLFGRTLDLYMSDISAARLLILKRASSARAGVREYLAHHIDVALDPRTPAGCFFVNTAVETETLPDEIRTRIAKRARIGEAALRDLLERAQAAGEISRAPNVNKLAEMITAVSYGIHVMARMRTDRKTLQAAADGAVDALTVE